MTDDRESRIRERAYQLWVDKGRPVGQEEEHWHEASGLVDQEEQAGVELLQDHRNQSIAKPQSGSVVKDKRTAEPPVNKSDEPQPVHAEQNPVQAEKKSKGKAKQSSDLAAEKAPKSERPRKGKVKSGSMETT